MICESRFCDVSCWLKFAWCSSYYPQVCLLRIRVNLLKDIGIGHIVFLRNNYIRTDLLFALLMLFIAHFYPLLGIVNFLLCSSCQCWDRNPVIPLFFHGIFAGSVFFGEENFFLFTLLLRTQHNFVAFSVTLPWEGIACICNMTLPSLGVFLIVCLNIGQFTLRSPLSNSLYRGMYCMLRWFHHMKATFRCFSTLYVICNKIWYNWMRCWDRRNL